MEEPQIPVAEYLFRRIASLGVRHVLGVPGDFNLTLLDHIYSVPELKWIGCCNELNAAYASDGYARIKGVPAALITTYGVGELSAMNGVAGAYAEHAGMIHIVGMTSRKTQMNRPLIHHTFEPDMDHTVYMKMSAPIRKAHVFLDKEHSFTKDIDWAVEQCVKSRLPVYIFIPMDVPSILVPAAGLQTPLDLVVRNDPAQEREVVTKILQALAKAERPAILADVLTIRHGGRDLIRQLADLTEFPTFACPLSKGIIDEDKTYYNGVYSGKVSFPGIQQSLESSDLILNTGALQSDSNTGVFTRDIPKEKLILLGHDFCEVLGTKFPGVHFLPVLQQLVEEFIKTPQQYGLPYKATQSRLQACPYPRDTELHCSWADKYLQPPRIRSDTTGPLVQDFVWQRLGDFLRPDDIIITECGTGQFGMFDATYPVRSRLITSVFWSSIGFATGACLGACVAAREMEHPGRVILIVGDGSLQMSVQEISTCIRYGFTPIIFLVNNNGYSIERAIRGPELSYNDINTTWDHQSLLNFFGARPDRGRESYSTQCHTVEELEQALRDPRLMSGNCISLCELFFSPFDYPWRLATQVEMVSGQPLEKQDKF